jgi:translation elongation factor P/translation initiation factor 5A
MKNLSGNANWFATEKVDKKVDTVEIIDDRVVLSYNSNDISYFLSSEGKPFIFKNTKKAESYIKKNKLENHIIDNFQDFDFSGIELIQT